MNRSDLRARVRALTNIYSTSLLSDVEINDLLQEANWEVCNASVWPPLTATTTIEIEPGTKTYELPEDVRAVLLVTNQMPSGIIRYLKPATDFDPEELSARAGDSISAFYIARDGSPPTLELYPEPRAVETLTVVYQQNPTPLDDDADEPPFHEEFHPLYAYVAAIRALTDKRGADKRLAGLSASAERYAERMRKHYISSNDRGPVRLGNRRWRNRPRWRA